MNTTRNGKIARLPRQVRLELNRRLDEGEPQNDLVTWLNSLPKVQAVLRKQFAGKPIRAQNLSEWKQGGYRDWLLQQEAQEITQRLEEDLKEWELKEDPRPLTDALALWMASRLAAMTRRIAETEESNPEEGWKMLREFGRQLTALRRSDNQDQRLDLAQMREDKTTEAELTAWIKKNRELIFGNGLDTKEKIARVRKLLWGLPDDQQLVQWQKEDERRQTEANPPPAPDAPPSPDTST